MNKKKTIIAALVLLLLLAIGGVMAYFTDTDEKTNTFTIGNVDISLSEDAWDQSKAQNLMPGDKVAKDPTIKNESASNEAYVYAEVIIPCVGSKEIFVYEPNSAFYLMRNGECTSDGLATKIYAYGSETAMTKLAAGASAPALFTEVTVANLTNAEASVIGTANLNMIVRAYGIQTTGLGEGFEPTPENVWAKFSE